MDHQFNLQRPVNGLIPPDAFFPKSVFQPLPSPAGNPPYHLDISTIITAADYHNISASKKIIFHLIADVGGIENPQDQLLVADHMEMQFDKTNPGENPAFLYVAGDVVYYYGKLSGYNTQFFEPYKFYPAPVFAIPGNHDGDIDPTDTSGISSLDAFVKMFCASRAAVPPEAGDAVRTTMTQPNVFWTLVTPVANIIGLYTNVTQGGIIEDSQQQWFIGELISANKERDAKALIVTLHHPPYSMDTHHGASEAMQQSIDDAFIKANVYPDIIFSGHVHNYQRFTRKIANKEIPYIVAGSGGYWFLHSINTPKKIITTPITSSFKDVTFEKYCEDRHGFTRVSIDMNNRTLTGEYFTVPRQQESWNAPPSLFDSFTLDLVNNTIKII
jgi:acid phosphatase type 7